MSKCLSELSLSFQKRFQLNNQNNKSRQTENNKESSGLSKPFDFEVEVSFGEDKKHLPRMNMMVFFSYVAH